MYFCYFTEAMERIPLSMGSLRALPWYVGASQVLGMACVVITGVWMGHYHGGYAWDGSAQEFNVHPLCMVLGLVFLYGDAVLVYRVFRNESKRSVKILHALLHMMALIISIVGLVAVFDFHAKAKISNMYSLHSWCGMLTFVLFILQWFLGLGLFLFPWASAQLRSWYLPLHVFFGLLLLAMSIGTCLLGITEKLLFNIMSTYSEFAAEGVLANTLGLLLVCFGVVVGYVATREDFRRPPNPEEEALSVHFKTLSEGEIPSSP
ncbi:transmembrane ascorbate-dependent reductase CYB561 isoform X1 [Triplophysa dalaica]|uniref:transmembrane ascorbate-dependent reductase CYB561 isoform X1 n=2 Tax=Triplophysa dalaica TaxID=1582913 RepID=UPI0024DFD405|nr:transmembrane ascorbate-dependent reductase CYB561 isoform X1 [Triplophysa dalaica]XP_056608301.1 transmembrane ascorbate-dependent reductase CYB561 isoform X1 [Triplophysa dalaica]